MLRESRCANFSTAVTALGSALVCALLIAVPQAARAEWTGVHIVHPVGWMHGLPIGETPGWNSPSWTQFEFNLANVWNAPMTVLNGQNGKLLTYEADFEQTSSIFEKGFALTSWLAFSVEAAYAHRNGGRLDHFIDAFHIHIGSERFRRQYFANYESRYQVSSDGDEAFRTDSFSGLSNYKLKFKIWAAEWRGENSKCPCGLGFSAQVKLPASDPRNGQTSGDVDYSGLLHLGVPLAANSAFFLTTGVTTLGKNKAFADWPRKTNILMIDATFDFGLDENFGILLQSHSGSPLFDLTPLTLVTPDPSQPEYKYIRMSSAWNSLVLWRTYESLGFRYRFGEEGAQFSMLFTEDWGIHDYDEVDEYTYVNNAPDVMASAQLTIPF